MSLYVIGDVQGCYDPLCRLLDAIRFDPSNDQLWFVGDLVNRGGQSLAVLRLLYRLRHNVVSVLGNHDLHLLAEADRAQLRPSNNQELRTIIEAPDAPSLLQWLARRPLMHVDAEQRLILVHAGIDPEWGLKRAQKLARRVEISLRGRQRRKLLRNMYGDNPQAWHPQLPWAEEMRSILNSFTRMRYRSPNGMMNFNDKGPPGSQAANYRPWFEFPRKLNDYTILFGHWSALGLYFGHQSMALDTGCVWGGPLTAVRLGYNFEVIQVPGRDQATRKH